MIFINWSPSYARLKGVNRTSVLSPPLMQNRLWRINNYSTRYLLCESHCLTNIPHLQPAYKLGLPCGPCRTLNFVKTFFSWLLVVLALFAFENASNFAPAVNRQPWFPRGRTRREGSACPPSGPCVRSVRVTNPYHARSLLVWYNWDCGSSEA